MLLVDASNVLLELGVRNLARDVFYLRQDEHLLRLNRDDACRVVIHNLEFDFVNEAWVDDVFGDLDADEVEQHQP